MARILVGTFMIRYPMGGNLSWSLQWLIGLQQLGHEVFAVERAAYPCACFDPVRQIMTDDCTYGAMITRRLLEKFGLDDRWCYADAQGVYHGLTREKVTDLFDSADLFLDLGTHGTWLPDATKTRLKVIVDGEPGYTQMKWEKQLANNEMIPRYDYYYSNGANIGNGRSTAPTAGKNWRHVFNPVVMDFYPFTATHRGAPFTTVMNWQAHEPISFQGRSYGQKDVEFARFIQLPRLSKERFEVAISGKKIPMESLSEAGWSLRNSHDVTSTLNSYQDYIAGSKGEFSVCKNIFVATNSGWFSDRSAAYLATGRPVVMQDTGFDTHLPCGRGLFAVRTPEQAAEALAEVDRDYEQHARWARQVAADHLDAKTVLGRFLSELGF